jgi:hypothetical protein
MEKMAALKADKERILAGSDWSRVWAVVREIAPETVGGTDYWETHTPQELVAKVRRRNEEMFHNAYAMTREANRRADELKASLDLSAKANNALALKIGRLVKAGDMPCRCPVWNGCEACRAWTAAKGEQ